MTYQPQTTQAHHKRVLCTLQGRFHLDMMLPSFVTGLYLRKSAYLEKWLSRHSYVPLGIFIVMLLIKIAILHHTLPLQTRSWAYRCYQLLRTIQISIREYFSNHDYWAMACKTLTASSTVGTSVMTMERLPFCSRRLQRRT